ncbi:MAG: GMC oxidoreductase [Polyangiaceae bacterium]
MNQAGRVVVIGTGPAGAAAAVFLSRAGLEPLLLEAGSGKASLGLTARVRGLTVAKLKPALQRRQDLTMFGDPAAELFEELAPGGLSNHWSCAVPRFSPEDFADAARAGERYTWPISYADLEPWYDRVEPLLRIAGSARGSAQLPAAKVHQTWELDGAWDAVIREARDVGRDVVAMPYAFGAETTVTRAATAFNAYTRLIKPIERDGGLTVRLGAQAVRLEWSPSERRVTAVTCREPDSGIEQRIPCRAVVLAAGAVNTAQILLESAHADFPDGLGNTYGVVGRYLHDHPLAKLVADLGSALLVALKYPEAATQVLENARDELLSLLTRAGWAPRLNVFRVEAPGNSVHYGGTCRMHASPRYGVVDAYCRVHDVPNVAIADSSVFTTGPEKNPVLTAMTLAARASARLADDLRSGDL